MTASPTQLMGPLEAAATAFLVQVAVQTLAVAGQETSPWARAEASPVTVVAARAGEKMTLLWVAGALTEVSAAEVLAGLMMSFRREAAVTTVAAVSQVAWGPTRRAALLTLARAVDQADVPAMAGC